MSVLIGLISPVSIGYADHVGVSLGRRGRLLAAILWIYIFTLLTTAVMAILWGGSPTTTDLILGGGSGLGASLALINLYRGYTARGVGIVGSVAAVTGAVIPIAVDAFIVGLPSPVVSSGMAVGVTAVCLCRVVPQQPTAIAKSLLIGGVCCFWWFQTVPSSGTAKVITEGDNRTGEGDG